MFGSNESSKIRVIRRPLSWIEGEALRQLNEVSSFEGMQRVVGMPDLHPGKGGPVGAAFLSQGCFYPFLIGSDIGCGMGFWQTSIPIDRIKIDRLSIRMEGLDLPSEDNIPLIDGIEATKFDSSLGTPGLGNHFIEIQAIHHVVSQELWKGLALEKANAFVLVHSGSRGLGSKILRSWTEKNGSNSSESDPLHANRYLVEHENAVRWATYNRLVCANRTFQAMKTEGQKILDNCHNSVSPIVLDGQQFWLHRKGAAPADQGLVLIPGSRGDLSYLVHPINSGIETLWSLAHGAGRKIARSNAKERKESQHELKKNRWGGRLICGNPDLVKEEASGCYKSIEEVIGGLEDAGLVEVIATFKPVLTFKTSEKTAQTIKRDQRDWQRDRREQRSNKEKERWK